MRIYSKSGDIQVFILSFLMLFTVLPKASQATHLQAGDIYYEYNGNGEYEIHVLLYRDCAGVAAPNSISIDVESSSCGINTIVSAGLNGVIEVSPLCPPALANSTCNGGTNPGTEMYEFIGYYTATNNCDDFIFSFTLCCRNNAIVNLTNLGSMTIQVGMNNETFNSNNDTIYNNSVLFTVRPTPYICVGQPFNYNMGTFEPDGDSLSFAWTNPKDGTGIGDTIGYSLGYTKGQPVASSPGMTLDPATGQITMDPVTLGNFAAAVLVEEWREVDGVMTRVGWTIRELQVVVMSCSNIQPTLDTTALDYQPEFSVCPGDTLEFQVLSTDANGDNIYKTANIGTTNMPGATFKTSCICPVDTGTFWWAPTVADVGTHILTLTVQDDGCPVLGANYYSILIHVLEGTYGGPDLVYCGDPVQLSASGGNTFTWAVISGDPIDTSSSGNFSCNPCASPWASPSITTVYEVTSDQTAVCGNVDTVQVTVVPPFTLSGSPDTSMCLNQTGVLYVTPDATYSGYTYNWSPSATLNSSTDSLVYALPTATTTYYTTVTAPNGCEKNDTITVTLAGVAPQVTAYNDTSMCIGDTAQLWGDPVANAIYSWSPSTDISDATSLTPQVWPSGPATYTLSATEYGADTVLWLEEFGSYADGSQNGTAGKWSTVQPSGGGLGNLDVQSNVLRGDKQGTHPGGYWQSESIDISNYVDVNLKADLSQANYDNDGDSVTAYYRLDGGTWIAMTNGLLGGPFSATTATVLGLTGSTVEIRVYFMSDDNSDYGYADSIQVIGNQLGACPGSDVVTIQAGATFTLSSSFGTNPICRLDNTTMTTTPSIAGTFTYQWTPTSAIAFPTDTLQTATANPLDTTTYYVAATKDGCTKYDTLTLNVKPAAPTVIATYDSSIGSQICAGDTTEIYAIAYPTADCEAFTGSGTCSSSWSDTLGAGNTQQSNKVLGLGAWATYSKKTQTIYRAPDVAALGMTSNDMISDIRVYVPSAPGGSFGNYVIRMGCTSSDGWTTGGDYETGTDVVKSSFSFTPVTGWNTITLDDPYVWDGASNLILEVCHDNFAGADLNLLIGVGDSLSATNTQQTITSISTSVAQCGETAGGLVSPFVTAFPMVEFKFCNAPFVPVSGLTYNWTPTTSLATPNDSNSLAYPTVTTTYTVTAYDSVGGGCVGFGSVTVNAGSDYNITSVTAAPDTLCGGNSTQLTVTLDSNFNYLYNWSPGATLDDSAIYNPLATPTQTTDYCVSVTRAIWGCERDSCVTVVVSGNTPDPTATTDLDSICPGEAAQLDVTLGSALFDSSYTWSPTTGLSDPNIADPLATPAVTTRYTVTVNDGGCTDTASVLVKVIDAAVTVDTIGTCVVGDTIQLTATVSGMPTPSGTITSDGVNGTSYSGTSDYDIGTYNSANRWYDLSNPFQNGFSDARLEVIYTAAELTAAGIDPGGEVITEIGFRLTNNSGGHTYNNFTVKLGATANTTVSGSGWRNPSSLATVYSGNYTSVSGWNMITLTSPYDWAGDSSLVIQICHDNSSSGTADTFFYSWTTPNSRAMYARDNSGPGCSMSPAFMTTLRPIARITSALPTGGFTYNWSPGSIMIDSTVQNPQVEIPTGSNTYSVEVTGGICDVDDDITFTCGMLLPIQLLSFEAYPNDRVVDLRWETSFEVAADRYLVQRAFDGLSFKTIGDVKAHGAYDPYKFTDVNAKAGVNYYRLLSVDTDGQGVYSPVRTATLKGAEFSLVDVSPNPTMDHLGVLFNSERTDAVQATVVDILGKEQMVVNHNSQIGVNRMVLDLEPLKAGVYFLHVTQQGQTITTKVVKQ